MLPFIISMSCLAGNFSWPQWAAYPSLGEALMRSEGLGKGAVAALVPTGQTTTGGQRILNTALFDTIFTKDVRKLGPAIAEAKRTLLANGNAYYEQVSETFLLFGDPAMALKVPLPRRPSGLVIEGQTDGIALQWLAAADGDGNAVTGYNLYRSQSSGGPYVKVNTGLINTPQYEDSAQQVLTAGTTYYYIISSVDADGGGGCFILTVSEPGVVGHWYWWILAILGLCLGVLKIRRKAQTGHTVSYHCGLR